MDHSPDLLAYTGSDYAEPTDSLMPQYISQQSCKTKRDIAFSSLHGGLLNTPISCFSSLSEGRLKEDADQWVSPVMKTCPYPSPMVSSVVSDNALQPQMDASTAASWSCQGGALGTYFDIGNNLTQYSYEYPHLQYGPVESNTTASAAFEQRSQGTIDDSGVPESPVTMSREPSVAFTESNASSAENRFYDFEPCHLAIRQDEESQVDFLNSMPVSTTNENYVGYAEIERAMSDRVKCEDSDSREGSHTPESSLSSDDLDYSEFLNDDSPEPRRQQTSYQEARYICRFCGKPFTRSFNFNTHMETHDPNRKKPFQCRHPDCYKMFYRPTDLKRHDQSVC